MKHRIFIAINLPEDIKAALVSYQRKWPDLPARWMNSENIHITLVFVGYVEDSGLEEIKQAVREVVKKHPPFSITLNEISYGPPKIIPPRMVWAIGENSDDFISLKNELEKELSKSKNIRFIPEKREAVPHITLARIKEWEWRKIEPEERPEVGESINFCFEVKSIELMESVLKRSGPEYTILESYFLNS